MQSSAEICQSALAFFRGKVYSLYQDDKSKAEFGSLV